MQTVVAFIGTFILTLALGPLGIIAGLLGVKEKPRGLLQWIMHTWCGNILRVSGVTLVVHNPERAREDEGHVYISNHVSWYDIFTLATVIPRYTWIAKEELRRIPLFGGAAAAAGIIFIDRESKKSAFEQYEVAAKGVKEGRSVVICPEGTRGTDYRLRPFKKGPFVLAIASGAAIIPTVLYGTREVMPKGSFRVRGGTVHVHFLEPVPTEGYTYEDRTRVMEIVWARMADFMRMTYGIGAAEHAVASDGDRKS